MYFALIFFFVEAVVAESVVVIKKLLQNQPEAHCDIIRHMARLMDSIAVPQARASILWLLGEYSQLVSTIAPDVLRKVAKTFVDEVKIVVLYIPYLLFHVHILICFSAHYFIMYLLCIIGRHSEITNNEFSS